MELKELKNEKKKVCFDKIWITLGRLIFRPFVTHVWVVIHTLGTA